MTTKQKKIAIISDVHSNYEVLKSTLDSIVANDVSLTIVLGDLLTYGVQPNLVINELKNYEKQHETIFIKGNHDQYYFDLEKKDLSKIKHLPEFIQETILWTMDELKDISLKEIFDWRPNYTIDDIYFSHANPYDYGDWSYVDTNVQCIAASKKLVELGVGLGVFGHVHRVKAVEIYNNMVNNIESKGVFQLRNNMVGILNPGTVGQQRGTGYSYMILQKNGPNVAFQKVSIDADYTKLMLELGRSSLSNSTKNKLLKFY